MGSRLVWLVGAFFAACGGEVPSPAPDMSIAIDAHVADVCLTDVDCSDGVYCNGVERCTPSASNADARGCVVASAGACLPAQRCIEATRACETQCDVALDADGDGVVAITCGGSDCDDSDALRFPGARELCDSDNRDEDCDPTTFGARDQDGDGFVDRACCNDAGPTRTCGNDCDDANAASQPGRAEQCDTFDNDCDGSIDERVKATFFSDGDGDGFGTSTGSTIEACRPTRGFVANTTDCDDTERGRNPGLAEICDKLGDNDCDPATNPFDSDHDGQDRLSCGGTDCNDADATVYAGAPELCNRRDDDCSGDDATRTEIDEDGDGYVPSTSCTSGTLVAGDCDDGVDDIHRGANERCNDRDDNCDGSTDEGLIGCDPIVDFAIGHFVGCFVRKSGSVHCWGANVDGETSAPIGEAPLSPRAVGITDATQIAIGQGHTCVVRRNGRVSCWGTNRFGELGDGTREYSHAPVDVVGVTDAVKVAGGLHETCALRSNGVVTCWGGYGTRGLLDVEFGIGRIVDLVAASQTPVCAIDDRSQVSCVSGALTQSNAARSLRVKALAVSYTVAGAVTTDGTVRYARSGDFGLRTIDGITRAVAVAVGDAHRCALDENERVTCWNDAVPAQLSVVSGLDAPIAIRAAQSNACALELSGRLLCWGATLGGALGNGESSVFAVPVEIPVFVGARDLVLESRFCAALNDGTVRCAGDESAVDGVSDAQQLSMSGTHSCALRTNGSVVCWGRNQRGAFSPTQVDETLGATPFTDASAALITNARFVAAGDSRTIVLRNDGSIASRGATAGCVIPADVRDLDVNGGSTCFARSDGTVHCCGVDRDDDGTLTNVVAVAASESANCAVLTSGEVWCWRGSRVFVGSGSARPARVTGIDDAIDVTVAYRHACALKRDGRVACWGANDRAQRGAGFYSYDPPPFVSHVADLTDAVEIDSFLSSTCARTMTGRVMCWGEPPYGVSAPPSVRDVPQPVMNTP